MNKMYIKTEKSKKEIIDIINANTYELNDKYMGKFEWIIPVVTEKYLFCGKIKDNHFILKRHYSYYKMDFRSLIRGRITETDGETIISISITPANGFILFYGFIIMLFILLHIVCRDKVIESIKKGVFFDFNQILLFSMMLIPVIVFIMVFYMEKYTTMKKLKELLQS